jgi:hypothetical protein
MNSSGKTPMTQEKKNRGSCGCVAIIAMFVVGCIAFMVFGLPFIIGATSEETWFVPGDADNFDPIATFDEVAAYAGDNVLLMEMEAYYVRSDGTMALNADYRPRVEYKFAQPTTDEADNDAPVGVPGAVQSESRYRLISVTVSDPFQTFSVRSMGSGGNREYQYMNLGMDRDTGDVTDRLPDEPVDAPVCPFADFWEVAIGRGAPRDAVATITYSSEGYTFRIQDTNIRLSFDFDCTVRE